MVDPLQGRICVGGVLVRNRRSEQPYVLMCKRRADLSFYPDVWDLPGGHVEDGEAVEDALVRELDEELGIKATHWRLLHQARRQTSESLLTYYVYAVTGWKNEPSNLATSEHTEIRWFRVGEVRDLDLADPEYVGLMAKVGQMFG